MTAPRPSADGLDYEELLAAEPDTFDWPALDERAAAMLCYTSGTTGNPKGVLYSHRSIVLHTLASCMAETCIGVGETTSCCPSCPMFHAAAWGLPFAAVATGAKLVFPGPHLDPASLLDLMAEREGHPRRRRAHHLARHPGRCSTRSRSAGTSRRCARWSSAARRRRPR